VSGDGTGRAHRVDVVDEIATLADPDYSSAFAVRRADSDGRTPEQWVRDVFEGAPVAVRSMVVFGWRYVSGFQLGPRPSADHVLGWKIVTDTPDAILLEVRSKRFTAQKVLRVEAAEVVTTTYVRYQQKVSRALWVSLAPVHHLTEPYLLGHAAAHPNGAKG
jgi:hypothetical protein